MSNSPLVDYVEKRYSVQYIGFYDIDKVDGAYVFWQENPDREAGHTNYLAVIRDYPRTDTILLMDGSSVVNKRFPAIKFDDGEIMASRSVHDYVTRGDAMLDGGSHYVRYNPQYPPTGFVRVVGEKEVYFDYTDEEAKEAA